ncbi:hypothetical protein L218DRAFT_1009941 [Marasmius fiardii PR-910]|nr:hypothetical protein L218DRAFT_1009941 [Marasmius fiardii PR-910]
MSIANNENERALTKQNVDGTEDTPFDSLSGINPDHVPTALQVSKFASHYLHIGNPKWFDWDSFLQAALNYGRTDLVIIPIQGHRRMGSDSSARSADLFEISSNDPSSPRAIPVNIPIPVSEIVDWIAYIITTVVGMPFEREPVYAVVENATLNGPVKVDSLISALQARERIRVGSIGFDLLHLSRVGATCF